METLVKARRIGGSIGVIIPAGVIAKERIREDDMIKLRVEKTVDLGFMWGKGKDIIKSTDELMNEIDEGEEW